MKQELKQLVRYRTCSTNATSTILLDNGLWMATCVYVCLYVSPNLRRRRHHHRHRRRHGHPHNQHECDHRLHHPHRRRRRNLLVQ